MKKPIEIETKFAVGDRITWTSQSSGTAKKKTGRILAVVRAGASARWALRSVRPGVPQSRLMVCDLTSADRYLVEVDTGEVFRFYGPLVRTIDGTSGSRGRKVSG